MGQIHQRISSQAKTKKGKKEDKLEKKGEEGDKLVDVGKGKNKQEKGRERVKQWEIHEM